MNHKGATHFTLNDRQTLERMLRKGFKPKAIAEALGKCERSIYYEIGRGLCVQRTTELIDVEVYCADVAHRKYKAFLKLTYYFSIFLLTFCLPYDIVIKNSNLSEAGVLLPEWRNWQTPGT